MAFNAKRFNTDAFTDGVWVNILGGEFKVGRAGNPHYERALEDSGYRKLDDPAEKQRALYTAIAKGVLKDWRDVEDDKGQAIPFTVDNAVDVLMDNPDLVGRLLSEANDLSNWKKDDVSNQTKKPRNSSPGKPASSE
ncbi:hypothetical protein ELY33_17200 [Vreelandella andesensis]|uniref:Tail assembly chaperone n=1 Tax=Vreelandella andesensis TaxID=447567 RepID=A0A433KF99_9GAMM|nr:hypothetical protein [Halomonas andesensis]RUR26845.1 hypothetical protein ELY33_17200 [Halomonas andesensis]